jgi:hypothetical protein
VGRALKSLLLAIAILLLLVALLGWQSERLVSAAIFPDVDFAASPVPAAPDYADPAAWTAHAGRADSADVAPEGLHAVDPARALADVFYVHPTTYLGSHWNGPVDDAALNAQTDELATLIQASAFNGCCAVYGPRYRQANGEAFVRRGPDGEAAIELAYGDVRRAFGFFLEHSSRGRPFLLAGHSQGSVLAARLLEREIAGTPLAERLVAAYLIGGAVNLDETAGVPPCDAPDATGCLVAWNARGLRFVSNPLDFHFEGRRLCVNPLSWRHDEVYAGRELNQGAVFLHAGGRTPLPEFADAQCREGVLRISRMGRPPRDLMSRILDYVIGPENYHPIEYQVFYMNLRSNAEQRVAAYRGRRRAGG